MTQRLLPEAIRGSWYLLGPDGPADEAIDDDAQLLAFGVDGAFCRYAVDGDQKELKEEGDYTFDGDFLILRGRQTDTYRVGADHAWMWTLEAKKKRRRLCRGLIDAGEFFEFGDDARAYLADHPGRVSAKSRVGDDADAIYDLIYRPKGGGRRRIGCLSVDRDDHNDELWVGVVPLVTNLEGGIWRKIVDKAYVDGPRNVDHMSVDLLSG